MMVSGLLDGFLRISEVGGLDPRILAGQLVTVHGRKDLPGVIVPLPANLLPAEAGETLGKLGGLLVDTGIDRRRGAKTGAGGRPGLVRPAAHRAEPGLPGGSFAG